MTSILDTFLFLVICVPWNYFSLLLHYYYSLTIGRSHPWLVLPSPLPDVPPDTTPQPPTPPLLSPPPANVILRCSTRSIKTPSHLGNFHCNLLHNDNPPSNSSHTPYPSYKFLIWTSSPSYKTFVSIVSSQFKPQFYHQPVSSPHWCAAMEANHTCSLVQLP